MSQVDQSRPLEAGLETVQVLEFGDALMAHRARLVWLVLVAPAVTLCLQEDTDLVRMLFAELLKIAMAVAQATLWKRVQLATLGRGELPTPAAPKAALLLARIEEVVQER